MSAVEGPLEPPPLQKRTLPEAQKELDALMAVPLQDDLQPGIEALPMVAHYEANTDSNFADKDAFVTGAARFLEEATEHARLNQILEEGQQFAVTLYTWRCCCSAIPSIKSQDQPNRMEIYEATVEVMEPEVEKLKKFKEFTLKAITWFNNEVKRLCHKDRRNDFVSEAHLLALGKFIDMFAVLDELKNIKAGMKNDYSAYRRAAEICKKFTDPSAVAESQDLTMFLAQHNVIREKIRDGLQTIPGYEELLCDIVNTSLNMYEGRVYLLPEEKHLLVKVIGFCLFLIDSQEININKLDARKKINLSKIDKIFKQLEAVPLYGDMMVGSFQYIQNTPNYDPNKWPECNNEKTSPQAELVKELPRMREQNIRYLSQLADCRQRVSRVNQVPRDLQRELQDLALQGLETLSTWSCKITEMYSWKLLHPVDPDENNNCPQEAEEYERATKYNYSSEEKLAMTQLIAMIKSTQRVVASMETTFKPCIAQTVYEDLQQFVQVVLREPLRKSVKHKKDLIRTIILAVQDTCADWMTGYDRSNDPAHKGKKDTEATQKIIIYKKRAGPTSTQLYMLRTMLESLVDKNPNKKTMRKDLDTNHITAIENFLRLSFFWRYLLNFTSTLRKVCDLSQFWFREFYLEMTRGKRIQFPIEMSMPWILTDHILENENTAMMEYIFYPLDLYSDSGQYALSHFKKQFLYDEIEAEVSLCFDQLVYKLSTQIFMHYKQVAGSIMLDRKFKHECRAVGFDIPQPKKNRYQTILKQTHVQLLGRTINLRSLISQRVESSFRRALEIAITRFESGDITGVMALHGLIECNRLAHQLLGRYLMLTDFDLMLHEANWSVSQPVGRISQHLYRCIVEDLLPFYCYNGTTNRFVRATLSFKEPVPKEKMPSAAHHLTWGTKALSSAFMVIYERYTHFVGPPHFLAIAHIMQYLDIALIMRELLEVIKELIQKKLQPYVKVCLEVMPKKMILPKYDYTSPGVLMYYQAQLQEIAQYQDMKQEVFPVLMEIGNAILCCLQISQHLNQEETIELKHATLFQSVLPKPYVSSKDKSREERAEEIKKILEEQQQKHKNQHVLNVISQLGTEEQKNLAKENHTLSREKLCSGLTIFEVLLKHIKSYLDDEVWRGPEPANKLMHVEESAEFYRLWSAIQYVICIPPGQGEYTIEEMFGEGLNWAGCVIMALLGQEGKFNIMDFCYHIMRVNMVDMKDELCKGVPLKKMIDRIRRYQLLNNQIFAIINKYMHPADWNEKARTEVKHMDPPVQKEDKEDKVQFLEEKQAEQEQQDVISNLPGPSAELLKDPTDKRSSYA